MIKGIKFPFQRNADGFPAPETEADVVQSNVIRTIVGGPGDRVMRPNQGMGAQRLVWEASGPVLQAWIDYELRRKLAIGEPRARVLSISVSEETVDDEEIVLIEVSYSFQGRPALAHVDVKR